jgi:LPXTG-site transpeptidase (sortase) family protein
MGKTTAPKGRADSNTRILRWAGASALIGLLLIYNSLDASSGPPKKEPAATASASGSPLGTGTPDAAAGPSRGPALPRSPAVRLEIPSIGVKAPFTELTLNADGALNPPPADDNNLVGWYRDGPSPGERGNAIVAGHVDTKTGPAVFWPLSALKPGAAVVVQRADGIVVTFVADSIETFAKDDFPDERVYGNTPDPELRLITCGGVYDRQAHDYTANVVVFAHLDSFRWS